MFGISHSGWVLNDAVKHSKENCSMPSAIYTFVTFVVLNVVVKFWVSMARPMIIHQPKMKAMFKKVSLYYLYSAAFKVSFSEVIYSFPKFVCIMHPFGSELHYTLRNPRVKTSTFTTSNPCVLKHCKRAVELRYHLITRLVHFPQYAPMICICWCERTIQMSHVKCAD